MPFKIVETFNEQLNRKELCICPASWEKRGVLHWPRKKGKKLCRNEEATPETNWNKINCTVKRRNIVTYENADKQLTEMLNCTTTEQEATETIPQPTFLPCIIEKNNELKNFNILAQQALNIGSATVSNTALPQPWPHLIRKSNQLENVNITSQQTLSHGAATISNPPEEIPFQEPLYAFAIDEPIATVNSETNSVPIEAINPLDLHKLVTNQAELYKNQEAILEFLKDNFKKSSENQQSLLMAVAHISVKFDTFITGQCEPQVTKLSYDEKNKPDIMRFHLKPIKNFEELFHLESILNDRQTKEDYKIRYSIVCEPGKSENCAYQLVDVFFTREFLTKCSWSGSTRGEGTKVCLKQFKNVLQLFFELIYECDHTYTIAGNERFFKSVLKNATKRHNSKLQRSSTSRNSLKRNRLEIPVQNSDNELPEEDISKTEYLVNEENQENIRFDEPNNCSNIGQYCN